MKDLLPSSPWKNNRRRRELLVINMGDSYGQGTHWVALQKIPATKYGGEKFIYFDCYALRPPLEVIEFCGKKSQIFYNIRPYQKLDAKNCFHCGHITIWFICTTAAKQQQSCHHLSSLPLKEIGLY